MARPKNSFEKDEVEEIIQLKLSTLKNNKNKLTYNNVWQFNKKLVDDKCLRKNGKPFTLYGYSFWATSYNETPYYGKQRIDEIKTESPIVIAGEGLDITEADLFALINRFKNKPEELTKRFIKFFKKNNESLKKLKEQNVELNRKIIQLRQEIDSLEKSVLTLYYNSQYSTNSLENVMLSSKTGDELLKKELKNIYRITQNPLFNTERAPKQPSNKILKFEDLNKLL